MFVGSLSYFIIKENFNLIKNLRNYDVLKSTKKTWEKCRIDKLPTINDYCKIGNYNRKVFLIGDSHLIPLVDNLGKKLNKKEYELINFTQPSKIYRRTDKENGHLNDRRIDFLKNIKNSIFIFGGYYQRQNETDLETMYYHYKQDFDVFLKNNNKIIFLLPIPELKLTAKQLGKAKRGKKN